MSIAIVEGKCLKVEDFTDEYKDRDGKTQKRSYSVATVLQSDDVGKVVLSDVTKVKPGGQIKIAVKAGHRWIGRRTVDTLVEVG